MTLGEKIIKERKEKKLSQEELAEKIGVTRQTISNWELNETAPNITEAKELSKIFNISLDELVDNDRKSILEDKISNTEKLAGVILKILKGTGLIFLFVLVIVIIAFFVLGSNTLKKYHTVSEINLRCTLQEEEYTYKMEYDKNNIIRSANGSAYITDKVGTENYNNVENLSKAIEEYFQENGGICTYE